MTKKVENRFEIKIKWLIFGLQNFDGQVAQSVEQRTENPCVGGSIPSLPTKVRRFTEIAFFILKPTKIIPSTNHSLL